MNQKKEELKLYSNFEKVKENAEKMGLNPVEISSRKDKKYMIRDDQGKVKHFGQMLYQDYTKTHDEKKRTNFRNRNKRWADAEVYTPAFLSYYLLW